MEEAHRRERTAALPTSAPRHVVPSPRTSRRCLLCPPSITPHRTMCVQLPHQLSVPECLDLLIKSDSFSTCPCESRPVLHGLASALKSVRGHTCLGAGYVIRGQKEGKWSCENILSRAPQSAFTHCDRRSCKHRARLTTACCRREGIKKQVMTWKDLQRSRVNKLPDLLCACVSVCVFMTSNLNLIRLAYELRLLRRNAGPVAVAQQSGYMLDQRESFPYWLC